MNPTTATLTASAIAALVLGGAAALLQPSTLTSVSAIQSAEESYKAAHGHYFQVMQGDVPAPYEGGSVKQALGSDIPTGVSVDTLVYPDGSQAYEIHYQAPDGLYVINSKDTARQFVIPVPASSAFVSSTST